MARATRYQGGSIISFVIVTIVVAALLVGGIIWLRQRGEAARQQGANEIASQQEEGRNPAEDPFPAGGANTNETDTNSETDQPSNEGSSARGDSEASQRSDSTSGQPTHLPETGPAETTATLLGVTALAYATTRYITSRRDLAATL